MQISFKIKYVDFFCTLMYVISNLPENAAEANGTLHIYLKSDMCFAELIFA